MAASSECVEMLTDELKIKISDVFKVDLRDNQKKGIEAVLAGKDVFVGTRTGSGKSLIYESIPVVKPGIVVIVAPLQSIMREQVEKLSSLGFKATYIGKDDEENEGIEKGEYSFLFGSPEKLVGETKWRDMLQSDSYKSKLQLLVVDEAHTVTLWGFGREGDEPFREWFSKIGELRSLFPNIPVAALTATSSTSQRRRIMNSLCFDKHAVIISESPDRENIKITAVKVPNNEDLSITFHWLIKGLQDQKEKFPRHLIFCETIATVSKLYSIFMDAFGKNCPYYNMFHSKTKETVKDEIRKDMGKDGVIRVLICTNSAGMGVNYSVLSNVIHYGLPHEMDTFVQQMGRAGRDGKSAHELILFKMHKRMLKKIDPELVQLAKDSQCRRKILCSSYACSYHEVVPLHKCCDICEKNCTCDEDTCPGAHPATQSTSDSPCSSPNLLERYVTTDDRVVLRDKLNAYKFSLCKSTNLISTDLLYGLTDKVIEDIVERSNVLFTAIDIINSLPVWDYDVAEKICSIINEVFGDMEMYNINDSDASDLEL